MACPSSCFPLLLLLLLGALSLLQAIPDEYDGFLRTLGFWDWVSMKEQHWSRSGRLSVDSSNPRPTQLSPDYHEVDATQDQVLLDGSELSLSPEVWTAVCEEIPECSGFNSAGYLKAFPHNASVDSYISKTSCGAHGPANITEGSCLHKQRKWQFVHCHDDAGHLDTWLYPKAQYPLPPNLLWEACKVDALCAGFMVTQDRQWGWLLEYHQTDSVTDAWIKVPKRRPHNASALHGRPRAPYRLRVAEEE